MVERPITSASRPASEACTVFASTMQAERRARRERRQADRDAADIEGMKPVDVLVGIDRRDHLVGIDLRRQRQLNQNAVHVADRR